MVKVKKSRYTLDTLRPLNIAYENNHFLDQSDVDKANAFVELIESTRKKGHPQPGDLMIYVSKHGDYYPSALIEKENENNITVCVNPFIPFVSRIGNRIVCDVSGGPFYQVEKSDAKFKGWDIAYFKDWGNCGPCANGAVTFAARVPLWEYREPDPLYGDFTTKEWERFYFSKDMNSEYLYQGNGKCFKSEEDFRQFIQDHEGTVFPGNWKNQVVVWCFRHSVKGISLEEWNMLDVPSSERVVQGRLQVVKIFKDMDKHESVFYYVSQ